MNEYDIIVLDKEVMVRAQDAVASYFRGKQRELTALSEQAVCQHPSLKGSHREEVYRTYLSHVLPKRYSVGNGMVYSPTERSREADIVIWDSHSYPSLPLHNHSFYFAESVRGVVELKSNWSTRDFQDALDKIKSVRDICPPFEPSLADEIFRIQVDLEHQKSGEDYSGYLSVNPRIGTVIMCLNGGKGTTPKGMLELCQHHIDYAWPDLLILMEPGIVVTRGTVDNEGVEGCLYFYEFKDDALLAFTSGLLKLLDDRVVHSEGRFYLDRYAFPYLDASPIHVEPFRLIRLGTGKVLL